MNYIKNKIQSGWNWIKIRSKKFWGVVGTIVIGSGVAMAAIIPPEVPLITLENPQEIVWTKPTTDAGWAEDVKKESLNLKFDYQLADMKVSLERKLPFHEADLDKITRCPDCIRWELEEQFKRDFEDAEIPLTGKLEGKTLQQWIDGEFVEQVVQKTWESEKVKQSIERIDNEIHLRDKGFVSVIDTLPAGSEERKGTAGIDSSGSRSRSPLGTTYYIDSACATPGNGTTATCNGDADDSWIFLDSFTESARSAGDNVILRRGNASTTDNGTDLQFTSDGSHGNPIIIEADYVDAWGDFASSTETATLTFGSTTITMSASSTEIQVGKWIYAVGDDPKEFAYEVATTTNATVELYLPYKGAQAGSGVSIEVMLAAPKWNTVAGNIQWNFDLDDFWLVRGMHIEGTDGNGVVEFDSSSGQEFYDSVIAQGSSNNSAMRASDDAPTIFFKKLRIVSAEQTLQSSIGTSGFTATFEDCILLGVDETFGMSSFGQNLTVTDCNLDAGFAANDYFLGGSSAAKYTFSQVKTRNNIYTRGTLGITSLSRAFHSISDEDSDSVLGVTKFFSELGVTVDTPLIQSDTGTVRSGGSNVSIKVSPGTRISTVSAFSRVKLLELPFYATTSSKTYTVYFASDDNIDWDANPTSSELWCELEAWASTVPAHRQITKSTETIDFSTDTDFDQTLTVTVAPAQAGVAYLRCYYAKTKEATNANLFYVDPIPEVS